MWKIRKSSYGKRTTKISVTRLKLGGSEVRKTRMCGELGNSRGKPQATPVGRKRLQEGAMWDCKHFSLMAKESLADGAGLGGELPSWSAGRKHFVWLTKARENLCLIVSAPASKALETEHSGRSYSHPGFFSQQTIDTELLRVDSCYSRFIFKLVCRRT